MKDSELLSIAKMALENDECKTIDHAIQYVVDEMMEGVCEQSMEYAEQVIRLTHWVFEMIPDCYNLEEWLVFQDIQAKQLSPKAMKVYRLAWIDQLIEICKKDGA